MGSNGVINLLSSDDETPSTAPSPPKAVAQVKSRLTPALSMVPEVYDKSVRLYKHWEEAPLKRRKVSHSSSGDGTCALPELPRAGTRFASEGFASRTIPQERQGGASLIESDPIVFTSSLGHKTLHAKRGTSDVDTSDDSLPEDLFRATSLAGPSALSARTAALLDSLPHFSSSAKLLSVPKQSDDHRTKGGKGGSRRLANFEDSSGPEGDPAVPRKITKLAKKPKLTEEAKAVHALEKEQQKALKSKEKGDAQAASKGHKAKEKEEEQERKRLLKEEKAREKRIAADLAEVNKSKLDKKDSTSEMIVDLPASIDGQRIDTQIREFLKNLGVDTTLYQSPIPNVIKWRRKTKALWNAAADHWEPLECMKIHEEKHVLCILSAKEFISLSTVQEDEDIETHVIKVKSAYDACTPVYLIEGLHASMKRNKTAENRAYQAKVNSLGQAEEVSASSQTAPKKARPAAQVIDEDSIEDALLRLQVLSGCLIHHTATPVETAEWVANFTQHISTIPYRYII
jgi:crossover junction endonuclease EME1